MKKKILEPKALTKEAKEAIDLLGGCRKAGKKFNKTHAYMCMIYYGQRPVPEFLANYLGWQPIYVRVKK